MKFPVKATPCQALSIRWKRVRLGLQGGCCLLVAMSMMSNPVHAEEQLGKIFDKVKEYVGAKNYPKALEELTWARKEIEKQHLEKLKEFFPAKVSAFEGQKFNSQGAFGMSQLERRYKNPDGSALKLSLTGSARSGQGLGGLAQFGKMAAMMGMQNGSQDTFRIDGFTATLEEKGSGRSTLSVFLESGSILKLEMTKNAAGTSDAIKQFAESLDLQGLDTYVKGQGQL